MTTTAMPFASTDSQPRQPLTLFQLMREDFHAHRGDWFAPGFRALCVYRFGRWRMSIKPKLLRIPFSMLYRFMYRRICNRYGIELPYSATLGRRVVIEHQNCIVIHGDAVIGDDSVIRQGVTIGNRRNDAPLDAPHIGRHVNIGAGAKLLGRITIGDHAVIGANAVVLNDVPAGALAVGVPARIITRNGSGGPDPLDTVGWLHD